MDWRTRAAVAVVLTSLAHGLGGCESSDPLKVAGEPPAPIQSTVATQGRSVPSDTTLAGYPNGHVLVARGDRSELAVRGHLPEYRWTRRLEGCNGVLRIAVASNSNAYVRTRTHLHAFDAKGRPVWKIELERVDDALLQPGALLDSSVVTLAARNLVAAYSPTGERLWTFTIDGEEQIVAPPIPSRTEGAMVVTNAAVYSIGADGTVRWRIFTG